MLAFSLAWLAVVFLLVWRALRQRKLFRDVQPLKAPVGNAPRVALIVPARNEEANIGPCIGSLLAQRYPEASLSILAVDDNSTDSTLSVLEGLASSSSRLTVLHAPELPPGRTGKPHACWIAAKTALQDSEWLCFVDADIEAQPELIGSAVAHVAARNIDFLSLTPRQTLATFSERLILPCGLYLLAFSQDLGPVNEARSTEAKATGQFILIRSAVYKAVGGHEAVRSEICEDVELARLCRRRGFRTALLGGSRLYSTRMYKGWSTLWPGVTKNLVEMLGGPASAILTAIIGLTLAWAAPLLPAIDAYRCAASDQGCIALAAALPASLAAFAFHIFGAAFFRIPLWYGLIFPLGYTVGAVLALDSVRRRLTGQIRWKGRVYG